MEPSFSSSSSSSFFFFIDAALLSTFLIASTAQSVNLNTTDFLCTSASPCNTYVIYRTQPPDFLDLGHISDLFGVSRHSIMKANHLPSVDVTLLPDQLLLIPVYCSCTGNRSFVNTTYEIKPGDSFYLVSISTYENLTDFQPVMDLNPTLIPEKLEVGQEVIFPVYCKCPTKTQIDQRIDFLVTYVWQQGDDISSLSKRMNTSSAALETVNNYRNFSAAVALPILIPVSNTPQLSPLIYLNATPPGTQSRKSSPAFVAATILLGAILGVVLLSVLGVACYRHRAEKCFRRLASGVSSADLLRSKDTFSSEQNSSPMVAVDKLLTGVTAYIDKPVVYEAKAILEATMNLDQRFRLGTGSVYQANLHGEMFAVKQCGGDVTAEVSILRKVNHANLVKLAGVSDETTDGSFFLVYEFAEKGSLDEWLYPKNPSSSSICFLSWKQRLMIALDVANALQYMHEHTRPSIVHRNISARNILLNSNFKAKISNFSLAAPASSSVSMTADVFGFGIVLLELLSGRKAMAVREGGQLSIMRKEIKTMLGVDQKVEKSLKRWMDPNLGEFYLVEGALNLAAMARACTAEVPEERPKTSEIVFSLSVLANSCSGEFEIARNSHSTETAPIIKSVVAR